MAALSRSTCTASSGRASSRSLSRPLSFGATGELLRTCSTRSERSLSTRGSLPTISMFTGAPWGGPVHGLVHRDLGAGDLAPNPLLHARQGLEAVEAPLVVLGEVHHDAGVVGSLGAAYQRAASGADGGHRRLGVLEALDAAHLQLQLAGDAVEVLDAGAHRRLGIDPDLPGRDVLREEHDAAVEAAEGGDHGHEHRQGSGDDDEAVAEGPAQDPLVAVDQPRQVRPLEAPRQGTEDQAMGQDGGDGGGGQQGRGQGVGRGQTRGGQNGEGDQRQAPRKRHPGSPLSLQPQPPAAQHRNDDEGHEEGAGEGDDQGHGQVLHELAHGARPEQERTEGGQGRQRRGDDGQSHLARGLARGLCPVPALLDVAVGVLDDDDGVVHEHAEGEDQGEQDHHVHGHAEEPRGRGRRAASTWGWRRPRRPRCARRGRTGAPRRSAAGRRGCCSPGC